MIVVGSIITLLLAFQAGVFVGFHKASMAFHLDERYERAYGEHVRSGPFGIPSNDFPEAHGTIGRVLSVSLPTIIVEDKNMEKIVRIASDTAIRKDHDKIDGANITVNDFVVVIGSPNNQQEIAAKFIRLLPPPPGFNASSSINTTVTK